MISVGSLGDNVRDARRREMLTQAELAEKAGVGVTTVARIEEGVIEEPRFSTLRKIAAALGVDAKELLP